MTPMIDQLQSQSDFAEGRRNVNNYLRAINSLSLGPARVRLSTLDAAHRQLKSILHPHANAEQPDVEALQYVMKRLPADIIHCRVVVLGSSFQDFERYGYNLEEKDQWQVVQAEARRRMCLYDGKETLACFAASISDEYDLLPSLMALQIEWNKLHALLNRDTNTLRYVEQRVSGNDEATQDLKSLQNNLLLTPEAWASFVHIWGEDAVWETLQLIAQQQKHFWVRRFGGSHIDYARTALNWQLDIEHRLNAVHKDNLLKRDIYFVSANVFSIPFLLTGFVERYRPALVDFVLNSNSAPELAAEYRKLQSLPQEERVFLERNLLVHASRAWRDSGGADMQDGSLFEQQEIQEEEQRGIWRIDPTADLKRGMQVGVRIIDIPSLNIADIDDRCRPVECANLDFLRNSNATVILTDYPLGRAAHRVLHVIQERLEHIRGVYIMGKAGTLNGKVGDIMLPNSIFDLHTETTYWFSNEIDGENVMDLLQYGSVFDGQGGVSVESTLLQNKHFLDFYYDQGYTCIETENGSFLEAIYEGQASEGHPFNKQVHLDKLPFRLAIVNYASDTPYTQEQTLAKPMGYYGADALYASSAVVMRSIFHDIAVRDGVI